MIVLFVLDVLLVLVFAAALSTVLRLPTRPGFLVALFVLVWADLVLVTEILSLLSRVTAWGMLTAHAATALVAVVVWQAAGRPRPPRFHLAPRADRVRSFKAWPDLWILGAAVVLAYALTAVTNGLVPPNNLDSLVYHLARVAFWIQHKSLVPWATPHLHQVGFPFNVEIGSLWSMVFLRRDTLAGFVQWFSALAAMVSVFGLARGFGSTRAQSAFAAFLFLTLPMIVLQSTTTQTDLTTGAMMTVAVYLLLLGLKTKHKGALALSGLAMGLALGMKYTAVLMVPGVVLALAYLTLTRKPRPWGLVGFWSAACLAGFVLLGSFNFVQNWVFSYHLRGDPRMISFRVKQPSPAVQPAPGAKPQPEAQPKPDDWVRSYHPLGSPSMVSYHVGQSMLGEWRLIRSNLARDLYSLMDFTGVPQPLGYTLGSVWQRIGRSVFSALRIPADGLGLNAWDHRFEFRIIQNPASEASTFFGPLGFLLWVPLAFYWGIAGFVKRDTRLVPALAAAGFILAVGAAQLWQPFRGRYYCGVMALCASLVAGVFGSGRLRAVLRGLIVLVAITVMSSTMLTNVQKPLAGPDAIWGKTPFERRALRWEQAKVPYRVVEGAIPAGATVADILTPEDPEYVLFGQPLSRTVIPVYPPPDTVNADWLKKNRYPYLVVHTTGHCRVEDLPADKFLVRPYAFYKVIIRLK